MVFSQYCVLGRKKGTVIIPNPKALSYFTVSSHRNIVTRLRAS